MKNSIKILIAAGGTGGHLYPGIAIAEEVKKQCPDAIVKFAGTKRGLEKDVLPKLGWPLLFIGSTSIKDRKGFAKIIAMLRLPLSVIQSFALLIKFRPSLMFSIGGYAAGPLAIASWMMRIPFVILEPNAIAGFTNRMVGKIASLVFIQFEDAKKYFPKGKARVSGNPVRSEVAKIDNEKPVGEKITLFIFGGSQGARCINEAIVGALQFLSAYKEKISIIHQTGFNDPIEPIRKAYKDAGVEAQVFEFTDRIWECYSKADFVIARAGATTIGELLNIAMPSLLVPYPYAADNHQVANAKNVEKLGGALMVIDSKCTGGRLARELRTFIEHPQLILAMRAALLKAGNKDATRLIVEEGLRLAK